MAANGSVDEQGAAGELDDISREIIILNSTKATLNGSVVFGELDAPLDDPRELASRLAAASWITSNNNINNNKNKVVSSAAPLTFCSQDDPRRTLRIDRSGSTESVVTSSGGDSSSSEPGSPSRPVTPQLTMAPTFECLRADSEDSGLGPSPAKSLTGGPSSPEGSVSPILRFDDRSDSLLDLSPRTDNSDELSSIEDNNNNNNVVVCCLEDDTKPTAIPPQLLLPQGGGGGSSFQFLLASTKNCVVVVNNSTSDSNCDVANVEEEEEEEDFSSRIHFPTPVTDCEDHLVVDEDEDIAGRRHYEEDEEEEEEEESEEPPSVSELLTQPRSPPLKALPPPAPSYDDDDDASRTMEEDIPQEDEEERYSSARNSSSSSHHLNPKVVLIRSDFGGQYTEESCSQQSSSTGECCLPSGAAEDGACKWLNCERSADANTTVTDLIDHIRQCHVHIQPEDAESFACLWVGCKVYARPSCSRSWLERHVLLHGGSKPFRCIVAGCRQRFGTEAALQRHVNSHFPQAGRHPQNAHQHKLSRNRRRHYKHRRRPQSHKSKDFFDDAIMEHVRHHLLQLSSIESVVTTGPPSAITFHSKITGKRKSEAGKVHYLLHWSPENIVPDTWVAEDEVNHHSEKTIPVSQLPSEALQLPVMDSLGLSGIFTKPGKRKRK